jgi:hypothetical protein
MVDSAKIVNELPYSTKSVKSWLSAFKKDLFHGDRICHKTEEGHLKPGQKRNFNSEIKFRKVVLLRPSLFWIVSSIS